MVTLVELFDEERDVIRICAEAGAHFYDGTVFPSGREFTADEINDLIDEWRNYTEENKS